MDSVEKRVIRCTQDNAADMRALVRRWPALQSLVTGLQAEGMFPGLRGLTITLEGPREWVDQGLAAELPLESKGGAQ